jgi:hypothetical protein
LLWKNEKVFRFTKQTNRRTLPNMKETPTPQTLQRKLWDAAWVVVVFLSGLFIGWEFADLPQYLLGHPAPGIAVLAAFVVGLIIGMAGLIELYRLFVFLINRPHLRSTFAWKEVDRPSDEQY